MQRNTKAEWKKRRQRKNGIVEVAKKIWVPFLDVHDDSLASSNHLYKLILDYTYRTFFKNTFLIYIEQ